MKLLTPFETTTKTTTKLITLTWLVGLLVAWLASAALSTTHVFPTPQQVLSGLLDLFSEGLVVHLFSSLLLCLVSTLIAVCLALVLAYLSPISIFRPLGNFVSKFRYLPLTGISFYIGILIDGARGIQIGVLTIFMLTFLLTSILGVIKDIPEDEYDHARTLGCSRWEILLEVVIKGRFDYVLETIRQNLAIVWCFLVTVESFLAAGGGLGHLINNGQKAGNNGRVIALQIIIILIGVSIDFTLTKARKLIYRYSTF